MPFSFTQIEKDKSNRIGFVFFFLIVFYFIVALLLFLAVKLWFGFEMSPSLYYAYGIPLSLSFQEVFYVLSAALMIGGLHWFLTVNNIIYKILNLLHAQPLNPQDTYHQRFQNIIEELSVATGGVKFEPVVLPTSALNAFALADFEGRYVIGVTEGLLSRLDRAQLETVIGHEAAHIISGDCLETTITTSLFDLYGDLLLGIEQGMEHTGRSRFFLFLLIGYGLLKVTLFISKFFRMFISREREYRADAVAVRLTRNPLSLAQALYLISKRWRGASIPGSGLEAIFIVSPQFHTIDETEGFFSDLFSTHPPLEKRMSILLDMAHSSYAQLEKDTNNQVKIKQSAPDPAPLTQLENILPLANVPLIPGIPATTDQWEVYDGGAWRGPFTIEQLRGFDWILYDAFIRQVGTTQIVRLFEASKKNQLKMPINTATLQCPHCQVNLHEDLYKGAPIMRCSNCSGVLMVEDDVHKIISRDDYFFSDHVRLLSERLLDQQLKAQIIPIDLKTSNLLFCPRCTTPKHKMLRNYYTAAYPIDIDRCFNCHSIWFDRMELEVLQYMIGKNQRKSS